MEVEKKSSATLWVIIALVCCVMFSPFMSLMFVSTNIGILNLDGGDDEPNMSGPIPYLMYYQEKASSEGINPIDVMIYDALMTDNFTKEPKVTKHSIENSVDSFIYYTTETTTCIETGTDSNGQDYTRETSCDEEVKHTRSLDEVLDIADVDSDKREDIPDFRELYTALLAEANGSNTAAGGSIENGTAVGGIWPPSSWVPVIHDYIWPVDGIYRITSPFGNRVDPVTGHPGEFHGGADIAAPANTPVHAARSGIIIFAQYTSSGGNIVTIDHGDGYKTRYLHLSQILVSVGDSVNQGDLIAKSGNTGERTTGAHLHFEIQRYDRQVDPIPFFMP